MACMLTLRFGNQALCHFTPIALWIPRWLWDVMLPDKVAHLPNTQDQKQITVSDAKWSNMAPGPLKHPSWPFTLHGSRPDVLR